MPVRASRCILTVFVAVACATPAPPPTAVSRSNPARAPADAAWQKLVDAWEHPAPLPDFELTDQDGKKFRLGQLGGGYLFLSFAFSSCQVYKACPTTMKKMRAVQDLWLDRVERNETAGRTLRLLTCTIDPENDTPSVLRQYGLLNGANLDVWTLATGPEGLMQRGLPSLLGVMAMRDGRGTLNHGVKAALLAPNLRPFREWDDNDFDPDAVIQAVLQHPGQDVTMNVPFIIM